MKKAALSPAEKELEQLVEESGNPVAVLLTEPYHLGSRVMSDRLQDAVRHQPALRLVRLSFASYRVWARRHHAHGTPTLLVFRDGKMTGRLLGLLEPDALEAALEEMLS